jgi:hypothetical protein
MHAIAREGNPNAVGVFAAVERDNSRTSTHGNEKAAPDLAGTAFQGENVG